MELLCEIKQGPQDVANLIEATGYSLAHISWQLGHLQRARLVRCEHDEVRTIWSTVDN